MDLWDFLAVIFVRPSMLFILFAVSPCPLLLPYRITWLLAGLDAGRRLGFCRDEMAGANTNCFNQQQQPEAMRALVIDS
jgi:hypothetical protein